MDGLNGQGNDSEYAVIKLTFFTGEMLVRCLRCSKTIPFPIDGPIVRPTLNHGSGIFALN